MGRDREVGSERDGERKGDGVEGERRRWREGKHRRLGG